MKGSINSWKKGMIEIYVIDHFKNAEMDFKETIKDNSPKINGLLLLWIQSTIEIHFLSSEAAKINTCITFQSYKI